MAPIIAPEKLYKYNPLPTPHCIRILRIESTPTEPLACSLEIVNLKDSPLYDCLSYTWGDPLYQKFWPPEDQRVIDGFPKYEITLKNYGIVGEREMKIGVAENLYEALKRLCRNKHRSPSGHQHGYEKQSGIWIDALCINQQDVPEKIEQVEMMRDIYYKAITVVIWLGPNDPDLETAMEVLYLLASIPKEKLVGNFPSDIFDKDIYKLLDVRYIESMEWQAFAAFLLRGWFTRIWVVQETWAARNIVVFIANHTIPWASITAAIRVLKATKLDELLNKEVEIIVNGVAPTTRYVGNKISNLAIFEDIIQGQEELDLERLLTSSRYFNATNLEDKVFAVRGMWNPRLKLQGKTAKEWLPQELGMKVEKAYIMASVVSMREMGDINLLSHVEDRSTRMLQGLPSWVPDYSVTPVMTPLQGIPRPDEEDRRWHASEGLEWTAPSDDAGKDGKWEVNGFHFDTIIDRAATEVEITDNHSMHTVLELFRKALDYCVNHASREETREEFWRALIKDTFRGKPAGAEALEAFPLLFTAHLWQLKEVMKTMQTPFHENENDSDSEIEIDYLTVGRRTLSDLEIAHSRTESLILDLSSRERMSVVSSWETMEHMIERGEELSENVELGLIVDSFHSAYVGRRMFRTAENHLGIAAESIESGDQIWILSGASVPMLLRKAGDGNWKLVGEAYVYGVMNGELVTNRGTDCPLSSLVLV